METFEQLLDRVDRQLDEDHREGYMDGHDTDAIAPNDNRSAAYKHSWRLGRLEREKKDVPPAWQSRLERQSIRTDAIHEVMQLAGMIPA